MSERKGSRRDGKTAGETAKNRNGYNVERVNRWRKLAEIHTQEIEKFPAFDIARLIAAAEGKPLSELIVDILCRERLNGKIVKDFPSKNDADLGKLNAYTDTFYEDCESTQKRNNHEKILISMACSSIATGGRQFLNDLSSRRRNIFMRRYYVKGDLSACQAICRAILFSITTNKGAA